MTAAGEPVPAWLRDLAAAARTMEVPPRLRPPPAGGRRSAVLVLFGAGPNGPGDPDLLFIPPTGFQVVPVLAWWRRPAQWRRLIRRRWPRWNARGTPARS